MKKLFVIFLLLITSTGFAKKEVILDSNMKKKLNVFFSNFSESFVPSFTIESINDELLINFALSHIYKNKYDALKSTADRCYKEIPSSMVDSTCMKYLGLKPRTHKNKNYLVPEADGEAFCFSQILTLIDNENGTFTARGHNFVSSSGFCGNVHATPEQWEKDGEEATLNEEFKAILKISPLDKNRYILVEYTTFSLQQF